MKHAADQPTGAIAGVTLEHSCRYTPPRFEEACTIGIGLGFFLNIARAGLAFGVKANIDHLDLTTIGFILIGSGVLVILLSLLIFMPRTRRARSTAITTDAYSRQGVVERDDRISGLQNPASTTLRPWTSVR